MVAREKGLLVVGFWQRKFQLTVQAFGNLTAARSLSPEPDCVTNSFGFWVAAAVGVWVALEDPHAPTVMAASMMPTAGITIFESRRRDVRLPFVLLYPKSDAFMDISFHRRLSETAFHRDP
jgi:hypothetical protein